MRSISRLLCAALIVAAFPAASQTLAIESVEDSVSQLLFATHAGDGSGRLFLVSQTGIIRIRQNDTLLAQPFLDISDRLACCGERGLLGLAFPPDYEDTSYFFVNYTTTDPGSLTTRISSFQVSAQDANQADQNSETILLSFNQPQSNHNAGWLGFGPDGYLYAATGDGGGSNDQFGVGGNGQDPSNILGCMLRLDVSNPLSAASPATNPFAFDPGRRSEIWAYGLRNPWRPSFDRETGDLYIADVGQRDVEEINFQPASSNGGENYGWRVMEGDTCFDDTEAGENLPCNDPSFTDPIKTYTHSGGRCSITGGYVYRGEAMPRSRGVYFYADYCSHDVYSLTYINGLGLTSSEDRTAELDPGALITSFGEDEQGELYIVTPGELFRIVDPTAESVRDGVLPQFAAAAGGDNLASLADLQNAGATIDGDLFGELDINGDNLLASYELLNTTGVGQIHHADTDLSGGIELGELLRVIQLYNGGRYTCALEAPASEDGFAIGTAPLNCVRHTADYQAPTGEFSLSEVLRVIQFFNTGGLTYCPGTTEDGFCPTT